MILCIGPEGSGKTLLLKRILSGDKNIDKKTVPTVGVNISTLKESQGRPLHIRELGGSMVPVWQSYYRGVHKVIYVVDALNLIQIGSATLALLNLLTHPTLAKVKVALVFNKTECLLPRNIKELLGVMRMDEVKQFASQEIVVFEVSALANKGLKPLIRWIKGQKLEEAQK